jgi:hypothetical protein
VASPSPTAMPHVGVALLGRSRSAYCWQRVQDGGHRDGSPGPLIPALFTAYQPSPAFLKFDGFGREFRMPHVAGVQIPTGPLGSLVSPVDAIMARQKRF